MVSGVGSVLLYRELVKKRSILGEFTVSFFYLFNFYSISIIWGSFQLRTVFYAFLPLMLFLFVKALKSKKLEVKLLYILAASFLGGITGLYFLIIILICFLILNLLIYEKQSIKNYIVTWILFILIFILINLYYLIPLLMSYSSLLSSHILSEPPQLFFDFPKAENIINSFKLLGDTFIWYWGWGVPTFSWTIFVITSPLFSVTTLMLPLYILFILFFSNKKEFKQYLIILMLLLIGVIISSAGSPPFGIYVFELFNLLHLTSIYEIPYEAFGLLIVVAYSLFIIYGTSKFSEFLKPLKNIEKYNIIYINIKIRGYNKPQKIKIFKNVHYRYNKNDSIIAIFITFLLISSVFINSYPIWTNQLIPQEVNRGKGNIPVPSAYVKIPSYYYSLDNVCKKLDHNYSLLVLPPYSPASHVWSPYNESATDPIYEYFTGNLNVINDINLINQLILENVSYNTFLSILAHYSIRYILLEGDCLI